MGQIEKLQCLLSARRRFNVFLDWFGVIVDAKSSGQHWKDSMASILTGWFGGRKQDWLRSHDLAFQWWLMTWRRNQKMLRQHGRFQSTFRQIEAGWIKRILREGGLPIKWSEKELFALDRALVREIGLSTRITNPWLRSVLGHLRRSGHRLFLSSGADSYFIRGALKSTRLDRYFHAVYSADELNTVKGSVRYWKTIFHLANSRIRDSVVVDDRTDYLQIPARLGALTVKVGKKQRPGSLKPNDTISSLRELPTTLKRLGSTNRDDR